MEQENDLIFMEDNEEIFWMLLSFFSSDADGQQEILKLFSPREGFANIQERRYSGVLADLAWCYITYMPDYFDESIDEPSTELYWLFDLMMSHGFYQSKIDFPIEEIWSLRSLKDDNIWKLVRKMARRSLHAWDIGIYPFDKRKLIDLEHLGPEKSHIFPQ